MRKCELCDCSARMFCESDQASLCWDCDEKVHCANFLVAKHSRCLLCHVCQSLTPWKASGPKLGPAVSVCDACVILADRCVINNDDKTVQRESQSDETGDEDDSDDDEDEEEDLDEQDEEEEEEEDENQVVPWSGDSQSSSPPMPPPPVPSSSCSSISDEDVSMKRMRDFADLCSDDEIGCSSQPGCTGVLTNEEAATTSLSTLRPLKQQRTTISERDQNQPDSRSTTTISSIQRLQSQKVTNNVDARATIIGICRLSRDKTY